MFTDIQFVFQNPHFMNRFLLRLISTKDIVMYLAGFNLREIFLFHLVIVQRSIVRIAQQNITHSECNFLCNLINYK